MVSKAREDLPEPLGPVITTSRFLGRATLTFFRLCCAARVTTRLSMVARSSTLPPESAEGRGPGEELAGPAGTVFPAGSAGVSAPAEWSGLVAGNGPRE